MSAKSQTMNDLNDELLFNYFERIRWMRDNFPDVYLQYPNSMELISSLKFMLATQSLYFKNIFLSEWIERNDDDQTLRLTFSEEIPSDIFKTLHNYVFDPSEFDAYHISLEELSRLFELISFYQFEGVRKVMNRYFIRNITIENCWELLKISAKFDESHLGNVCGQFIAQNEMNLEKNFRLLQLNKQVLAFLLQRDTFYLPEEEIFSIAFAWCKAHPGEDITLIKESIRMSLATDQFVLQKMTDWCGTDCGIPVREYRQRSFQQNENIPNLFYFV